MLTVFAPAKINLTLHVTGRRADGYHLLDSLVAFADIGDRVTVSPAEQFVITLEGPFASALSSDAAENLAVRAARLLAQAAGKGLDVTITLQKNLPVASGIGGGSADAAAVLRALGTLWDIPVSDLERLDLASLGADIPACLVSRAVWMRGVGEQLSPAPALPACGIVVVNSGAPCPTGPVFAAFAGCFSQAQRRPERFADFADFIDFLKHADNDLAAPARALVPEIGKVESMLAAQESCAFVRLSGSGATCFGLFADQDLAERAAMRLASLEPGWWVRAGTWAV